jgi:hypothetical protein
VTKEQPVGIVPFGAIKRTMRHLARIRRAEIPFFRVGYGQLKGRRLLWVIEIIANEGPHGKVPRFGTFSNRIFQSLEF